MRPSDMKPRADSAHRRNATGRKVIGEQLRGLHLRQIGVRLDQPSTVNGTKRAVQPASPCTRTSA
jgi:hypothetical protein